MSIAPDGLPPLAQVINQLGLRAQKSLGQNFLLDLNLTGKIARQAKPFEGHDIIEIGPGPGGLTRALLHQGAEKVIAIERDQRCLPALEAISKHFDNRLTVIEADALNINPFTLSQRPFKIVANLPYNIATPLVIKWLQYTGDDNQRLTELVLMFQKEVAQRLCARVNSKAYGRLSILAQTRAAVSICFDVHPGSFTPQPRVTSSIVRLVPQAPQSDTPPVDILSLVSKAAFGQRRKMLRTSLKTLAVPADQLLEKAQIDPTARAEQIDIETFARLARAYIVLKG